MKQIFKKSLALLLVVVLGVMLLTSCDNGKTITPEGPTDPEASSGKTEATGLEGKIVIGATGNVTGYDPASGESMRKSANMACDIINSQGGILGKKLEVIIEDDMGGAEGAVNAVNKLIADKNVVAITGLVYSSCALAVEDIVRKGEKPTIVAGSAPAISEFGNPWMFRQRTSDTVQVACAVDFMIRTFEPKKVGCIYTTDDYSASGFKLAEQYFSEQNIEIFADGGNVGDKDFMGQITKMRDAGCDSLFLWANAAELAIIARQMNEIGYKPNVLGGMVMSNSAFIDVVTAEECEGWYTVSEICFDSQVPGFPEFMEEYQSRYGAGNPESSAIIIYGELFLLKDAIERAGSTDPLAIADALRGTKDLQLITGLVTCDENNDLMGSTFIKQLKNKVEHMVEMYSGNILAN